MFGKINVQQTYQYAGSEVRNGKELEKILITHQMDVGAPEKQPEGQPAFDMKLKEQENRGTIHFDNTAGRFVENQGNIKMKMEVTVAATTMELEMETEVEMKLVSAGSDQETPANP